MRKYMRDMSCYTIIHSFRDGVFLGRDMQTRDVPLVMATQADAAKFLEENVPEGLRPDWQVVPITITDDGAPKAAR